MEFNGILKRIGGGIGVILLGSLSNPVWESILKPIFSISSLWIFRVMNSLFGSYKDNLYKEVGNGFHELPSNLLFIAGCTVLIMLYFRLVTKHPTQKESPGKLDRKIGDFIKSKKGYWLICGITFFATGFLYVALIESTYINKIITYSERSIGIVNPYLSEKERLMLKSKFNSIYTAKDFYNFKQELETISKKNNIQLPEIKIIF